MKWSISGLGLSGKNAHGKLSCASKTYSPHAATLNIHSHPVHLHCCTCENTKCQHPQRSTALLPTHNSAKNKSASPKAEWTWQTAAKYHRQAEKGKSPASALLSRRIEESLLESLNIQHLGEPKLSSRLLISSKAIIKETQGDKPFTLQKPELVVDSAY